MGPGVLGFGVADDQTDEVGAGVEQEAECCGGLGAGVAVVPADGDVAVDGAEIFSVVVENGRDDAEVVGVAAGGLMVRQVVEGDPRAATFNFDGGLPSRTVWVCSLMGRSFIWF